MAHRELFASLNHEPTMRAVRAERAMLAALGGGCQVPIAALAVPGWNETTLHGAVLDLYGARTVRAEEPLDGVDPEHAGRRLAAQLMAHGAHEILGALRGVTAVSRPQPE